MSITLGSNIASLQAQRQLFNTDKRLSSVFERLSSGQRINRASDDAAGLAISESLRTDRRVFNQGIRNLNDGLSLLNIADSTVSELSDIVIRIQELAEQAANGTLSNTQRGSLDEEAQALSDEFFRVSRSTGFNGQNLFDGTIENGVRLQGGYGEDGSIFSSLGGAMGDGTFTSEQVYSSGVQAPDLNTGDLNGDGNLDLYVVGGNISVFLGDGAGNLQSPQTVSAGNNANRGTLGDLNGDGVLDIVTSSFSSSTFVFLGNGDGTFQSFQSFSVAANQGPVELADVNGDGALDVVSANNSGNNISVLLGNGDGTLQSEQTYNAGNGPNSLDIGDLNGDGVLDVVTGSAAEDEALVLIGNGDGTFQTPQTIGLGNTPTVSLADFNGDGALDLFSSNAVGDDITLRLGNGDGTFGEVATFQVGNGPQSSTVGDVNGDGALDIITPNSVVEDITVILGVGDGTFGSAQTFTGNKTGGSGMGDIELGDYDNDGVLDLLTAHNLNGQIEMHLGGTREGIAPILDFSLETQADALQALAPLERKLLSLSEQRGTIGAFQSRLQSALATLGATSENYASAESRIKDADIAFESSQLTRLNILQQAASAVLGQANQQPALALQLLS